MDHTVKLWDMALEKKSRYTFRDHGDSVNSIHWRPFTCEFASGSSDCSVNLWDIRTRKKTKTLYGHEQTVNSVKYSLDGQMLVSADADGIVKVWDVRKAEKAMELTTIDTAPVGASCAIFDKSNKYVLIGVKEQTSIQIWNL